MRNTGKTIQRLFVIPVLVMAIQLTHLRAAEITVFAASSLTDVLKAIATAFEKQSADKIVFNFAASSTLARQIEAGAPADVFFSADEFWMNALAKGNLIVTDTRRPQLGNALVVVVPADSQLAMTNLDLLARPNIKRVALADPDAVPAGIYAKALLKKKNLWHSVEPKVIPTGNVRACLAAVESGNVDAGIVYKTDAAISRKIRVALELPQSAGPKIEYPVAMLTDANHPDSARRFLKFLDGKDAGDIFVRYGFVPLRRESNP